MKVLSLFDGMSCGQIALNRLGIKVDTYYASEIDKYAMEITQKNFPKTIQIGDVCAVRGEDYQDVDLILAGSPCQGFSFAGKQLAFNDPRSALFFEFIRLLKEIKPKYFLLENVKMKKEYLQIISEQVSACYPEIPFGIEPIFINSSLVSAQSRQRYYWTNIPNITQPEERGIVLRDILEEDPSENPVKDTARNQRHYKNIDEKSLCMTATMYKGAGNNGMTLVPIRAGAWRGRSLDESGKNVKWKETTPKQMLETRKDEKSNAVSTFTKDNVVVTFSEDRINKFKETLKDDPKPSANGIIQLNNPSHSSSRVYSPEGKSPTLMAGNSGGGKEPVKINDGVYWRKLTPVECERLQTVPDNYTEGVSNTQRYKMLGNGWTVEVICHILKNMESV